MIIWKLIIHLINLSCGVESEITFVSIHANSNFITLDHILLITDGTRNNINNPFKVAASIFFMTFKGLIVSGTTDVVRANKTQT